MNPKRILIIDDDTELCEELIDSLISEGYEAERAPDAIQGEKFIRSNNYDVILLDYKMPLFSGLDILNKLKTDNIKKKIIIITGRPSAEKMIEEDGLSDMISGIISKPIDFKVLLEKIREL